MDEDAYVATVLHELIQRFSQSPRKADVRQSLLEAKRLKSIASNWVTVAPSPDSRTAFMERMAALLATAEADAPPGTPGITPPRGFSRTRTGKSSPAMIEGLSRSVSTTTQPKAGARRETGGSKSANRAPPTKRTQQFPAPQLSAATPAPDATPEPAWRSHESAAGVERMIVHADAKASTWSGLVRLEAGKALPVEGRDAKLSVMLLRGTVSVGPAKLAVGEVRTVEGDATGAVFTATGCTLAVVETSG